MDRTSISVFKPTKEKFDQARRKYPKYTANDDEFLSCLLHLFDDAENSIFECSENAEAPSLLSKDNNISNFQQATKESA